MRRNYSMQRIGRKRARVSQCDAAAQHSDAAAAERRVELHLPRTAPRAAAYIRLENTLSIRKMLNSFDRITEFIKRLQRVNDWLRRRLQGGALLCEGLGWHGLWCSFGFNNTEIIACSPPASPQPAVKAVNLLQSCIDLM